MDIRLEGFREGGANKGANKTLDLFYLICRLIRQVSTQLTPANKPRIKLTIYTVINPRNLIVEKIILPAPICEH